MKRLFLLALFASALWPAGTPLQVTKTPTEQFNVGAEFSNVVGSHGISIVAIAATDLSTGSDVTGTIVMASPAPLVATSVSIAGVTRTGQYIIYRVQGGTNGQVILLRATAADLVTGERFDGLIMMTIRSNTGR